MGSRLDHLAACLRLTGPEKTFFTAALVLLVGARVALATARLPRARSALAGIARRLLRRTSGRSLTPERIGWLVEAASRFVPTTRTCLPRALAAEAILAAAGRGPELHIGVARAGERTLDAHAWVACQGVVVIGDGDLDDFAPLPLSR